MKKLFFVATMFILCAAINANAQDGMKIGYTQVDFILANLPEFKGVQSDLEAYGQQLDKQLQSKIDEFEKKAQELQANYNDLLPEIRSDKEQELQQLRTSIQKFQEDAQVLLQRKQGQLLQPLYDKIQNAIDAVRKENNFAMIINAQAAQVGVFVILSADEKYDVSNLVFKKLGVEPPADGEALENVGTTPAQSPETPANGQK